MFEKLFIYIFWGQCWPIGRDIFGQVCTRGCVFLREVVCFCVWEVVCFCERLCVCVFERLCVCVFERLCVFLRGQIWNQLELSLALLSHTGLHLSIYLNIVIFNIFNPIIFINLILFIPTLFILKLIFSLFCKPLIHHFQIIFHFMIFTDERILRNATKKVKCLRLFVAFLPQLLQVNPIQTKKIWKKLWRASYVTDEQLFIAGICRLSIWETPL